MVVSALKLLLAVNTAWYVCKLYVKDRVFFLLLYFVWAANSFATVTKLLLCASMNCFLKHKNPFVEPVTLDHDALFPEKVNVSDHAQTQLEFKLFVKALVLTQI